MKIQPHHKTYAATLALWLSAGVSLSVTILGTVIVFGSSAIAIIPSESNKCDHLCKVKGYGGFFVATAVAMQFFNAGLKTTRKLNYEANCLQAIAEDQLNTSKAKA